MLYMTGFSSMFPFSLARASRLISATARLSITAPITVLVLLLAACGESGAPAATDSAGSSTTPADGGRPNIVVIMADDLGYADLGAYGSEIPTPNLDSLAAEGMMMTDFHASMACSPTRAMFMSGVSSHLAGLAVMGPPTREDQIDQPGYEAHLNFRVASLANLMKDAGYATYMTGKWHLGTEPATSARTRGFERSFVSLSGAAHLGGLSWNGPGQARYRDENNDIVHVDEDFYSTRFYTDRMIDYIEQDRQADRPFFAWLAYTATAPHWPLQAPPASIARFRGRYDEGWEVLYERRYRNMQRLGLIDEDVPPRGLELWQRSWDSLSEAEQRREARKMEIYAAMVSDLDTHVGRFLDYLESIGELDNTFIFFMSDNGAEGLRRDRQAPLSEWVAECCNNSYDNLGSGDSYVMYGPDWATASTVALRDHKTTAFEGGIRVPAFARYPATIEAGQRSDAFATVMDLMPTFLALAGSEHPGTNYQGRVVHGPQGRSLLPLLSGDAARVHDSDDFTGWELYGHRGIRQGPWKIVWDQREGDDARWRLFNVEEDRQERRDLGREHPDRLEHMISLWDRYAAENGVIY